MFKRRLQAKLFLTLAIAILTVTLIAVLVVAISGTASIRAQAQCEVSARLDASERLLTVIDGIMQERVQGAMALLNRELATRGAARLGEHVRVGERQVPDLLLNGQPQANQFELVDQVTAIAGGTATLFVRDGDEFVRISTNVMREGKRAVGTVLDPTGKAIQAIRTGQPFFGQVDILGNPFLTGYTPIHDAIGAVIGISYVGYKADLKALEAAIADSQILTQGMMVLLDDRQRVRLHSRKADPAVTDALATGTPEGWVVERRTFAPWNYTILAAFPNAEIQTATRNRILTVFAAGLGIGGAILLLLGVIAERLVMQPVRDAMRLASGIAQGHLDQVVVKASADEIGQMMQLLERMQGVLRQFVEDVARASDQVGGAAGALSQVTAKTVTGALDQLNRSDQVAAAMTEMSATVATVAANAGQAAEATRAADHEAEQGLTVVRDAVSAIQTLASEIEQAGHEMRGLAEQSTRIGGVIDVIRGIAEQTNLLALNAAIEAARAGEQGRGFAVVADEVRTLASRTQGSTREIQAMIQSLQTGAQQAEARVLSGRDKAQDGVTHVQQVAKALDEIARAVGKLHEMNAQIASSTKQQSAVAEDVNDHVHWITEVAESTSQNARQTAVAAEQLNELSNQLRGVVQRYRV